METASVKHRFLYIGACLGFAVLVSGLALGVLVEGTRATLAAVILESLGAAILFPILISFAYDRLREKWFGDEVWRIFNELSDAGITRIYKGREPSKSGDNAQERLADEFRQFEKGEILMMGVSLRVFFNPMGPFYRDIVSMLTNADGNVTIRAMVCHSSNPDLPYRAGIEESPPHAPPQRTQIDRDLESTTVTARSLTIQEKKVVDIRFYNAAPYCTTVIFPHVCYYSPNLLAPRAPVNLPMILFRAGSHGYSMIKASFEYLWAHRETRQTLS